MNTAYLLAFICAGLAAAAFWRGPMLRDNYGTTGSGVAIIAAGGGLLFAGFIFCMIGLDLQYPGTVSQ